MIIILSLLSYFLGQILVADIFGRLVFRKNIFQNGSGNPGARNAGRVFGKKGFLIVLVGDILKSVLAILLAKQFGLSITLQILILLLVILGHMYPLLYKFKGGKGVASFLGGLLIISPYTTLCLILTFLIVYPIKRSFTISGLIAIILTPFYLYIFVNDLWASGLLAVIAIMIIIKHR